MLSPALIKFTLDKILLKMGVYESGFEGRWIIRSPFSQEIVYVEECLNKFSFKFFNMVNVRNVKDRAVCEIDSLLQKSFWQCNVNS